MADQKLQAKIDEWLKWDRVIKEIFFIKKKSQLNNNLFSQNLKTRAEIEGLVKEEKFDDLKARLLDRMEFGTAGLRSRMGAGYTMMNDLTIIQTAQGFLEYLKKHFADELNKQGIILGFDARHNSKRFAQLTANIFLRENIPVYLFRQITPTPFVVSFNFKT